MGILYGGMLANLLPQLWRWWLPPTALVAMPAPVADWLRVLLVLLGAGVFGSGVRDLYAALDPPLGTWPWPRSVDKGTQL